MEQHSYHEILSIKSCVSTITLGLLMSMSTEAFGTRPKLNPAYKGIPKQPAKFKEAAKQFLNVCRNWLILCERARQLTCHLILLYIFFKPTATR